jgi:hypothetical protein
MENMLFGPWLTLPDGSYGKRLADGQVLVVNKPPHPEKCCVIKPEAIILSERDAETGADNALKGTIISVFKENHSETVRAHVACNGTCLKVTHSENEQFCILDHHRGGRDEQIATTGTGIFFHSIGMYLPTTHYSK